MDSRVRHITKSITWRIVASATTFSLTLAFFGKAELALASWLTAIETSVKIIFYYFHERIWFKLSTNLNSKMRHIAKAVTWRLIASGTTFILALVLFGAHEGALEKATWIALIESVLKMGFYYGHEEIWYRINLGLDNREKETAS
ncbi:MAG: DUF2061 domain-containing protein [Reichenbachiella sp.]|uniref:DUF2061 domain-containing protein n=2 Tax=Reichenbachiella sp. TaxID=2184521 RepID=UPI003264610B